MQTKNTQKTTKTKNLLNRKSSYSNMAPLVKSEVLGIGITNATEENILEYIIEIIQKTQKNIYVVTPNPEIVMLGQKNADYKKVLNEADLALCDGAGLYVAARLVRRPLAERIIGTNFVERLCEKVNDWPITVGFLGAGPKIAERASECLSQKYPKLKIAYVGEEWPGEEKNNSENAASNKNYELSDKKEKSIQHNSKFIMPEHIDVLFVAFGAPKQELWMAEHINKIPVRVMIGVGGAFDQIVDSSLRPPAIMHVLGLGWLYRLIREPWRLKRQLVLLSFIGLVLREKIMSRKSK